MANVTGTIGADTITVDGDQATVNGAAVAGPSPTEEVSAAGGNDTISVDDSSVLAVRGGGGDDTLSITSSTIDDRVLGGSGDDSIAVTSSTVNQNIAGGSGQDVIQIEDLDQTNGIVIGGPDNDLLLLPAGTVVTDISGNTFTVVAGALEAVGGGTAVLPTGQTITFQDFELVRGFTPTVPVCFCAGTLIQTPDGPRPIETLSVGDMVTVAGARSEKIRWIGQCHYDAADLAALVTRRPVRIAKGALGAGVPRRDLLVSRQHRILICSKISERMFGTPDVLIAAARLVGLPRISVDHDVSSVHYIHLLLDRHAIILAEGAQAETLLPGPQALGTLAPHQRAALREIFGPDLPYAAVEPAAYIPTPKQQKALIGRHLKNAKPVFDATLSQDWPATRAGLSDRKSYTSHPYSPTHATFD